MHLFLSPIYQKLFKMYINHFNRNLRTIPKGYKIVPLRRFHMLTPEEEIEYQKAFEEYMANLKRYYLSEAY